jgi:predicted SprT family Zn-dependent metalloprotease
MYCCKCQKPTSKSIEIGLIDPCGRISGSVFVCQDCRKELTETTKDQAGFYDYSTGLWLRRK